MKPDETITTVARAVASRFTAEFGGEDPRVFFAPGRVNLVGAHLDYNGGLVLPVAVDRGVYVAARLRGDRCIRLRSIDVPEAVDVATVDVRDVRDLAHGWASYPLGVWRYFHERTGAEHGFEMVIGGDVPIASGLSSSAAVEVATAKALNELHSAGLGPADLAMLGYMAETRYVGLRCGIMDQFASALARDGHALLLDCHESTWEHVPLDSATVEILVMNTGVPRALGDTKFNQRVAECGEALRILRQVVERPCLAAYTPGDIDRAGDRLRSPYRERARHVVTEMHRVRDAVDGLKTGNIGALGRALNESHLSTREDYAVSSPELDAITDAARECPGVFGARLTGAGFGGCAIALIEPGRRADIEAHVMSRYREVIGRDAGFDLLREGTGPCEITFSAEDGRPGP